MLTGLKNIMDMPKLPPVILLTGEEEYPAELAYKQISQKVLSNDTEKFEINEIDAEDKEISINTIVDLCSSISMMGTKTLFYIKNFEKLFQGRTKKENTEKSSFYRYLQDPNPENILLIRSFDSALQGLSRKIKKSKSSAEAVIEKLKFPYNIIIKNYPSVEFPKIWENQMKDWIVSEFKKKNKNIDGEAAEFILAQSNPELRTLHNEIEKIDIYLGDKDNISINDVSKLVGASRSFNVFELQKMIGNRNTEKSILILKNMLSESSSEMLIITMLTRYFKKVWELDELIGQYSGKFQLAGKLGISPMFIDDYKVALRKYKKNEIIGVFKILADTDEQLKTSRFDKFTTMQNMIVQLTG